MEEMTEPQPTPHATDDLATDDNTNADSIDRQSTWSLVRTITNESASQLTRSTLRRRSSSSISYDSSSPASISDSSAFGRRFELETHRFPPVPPSTSLLRTKHSIRKLKSQLATLGSLSLDVGPTGRPLTVARSSRNTTLAKHENNNWRVNRDGEDEEDKNGQTDAEAEHDQRIQDAWARLQDQRAAVRQLRLQLGRRRRHLHRLETRVDDADNAFMNLFRDEIATGGSYPHTTKAFLSRYEVMQQTRKEYRSEQAEVQQREDQLAEAEIDSEARETDFYSILFGYARDEQWQETSPPSVADMHSHDAPSRTSLLGIPSDRPVDSHPLFRQLMGALGHRENLKEHYSELMAHRGSILFDLELAIKRERLRNTEGRPDKFGAVMDTADIEALASITTDPGRMDEELGRFKSQVGPENWSFLVEFPERENLVMGQMAAATAQVHRLRQLCIDKGLIRKHLSYYDEYIIFADTGKAFHEETISISPEELPQHERSRSKARFPLLQSNPRYILHLDTPLTALKRAIALPKDDPSRPQQVADAIKEHSISTLLSETKAEDKSEFVNRWLLQRLRTSSLEIAMLYTVFCLVTKLQVRNITRWQEDVLFFWSRDACNYPKERFRGPITAWSSSAIDDPAGTGISDPWSGTSRHLGSTDSASKAPSSTNENPEPMEVDLGEGPLAAIINTPWYLTSLMERVVQLATTAEPLA